MEWLLGCSRKKRGQGISLLLAGQPILTPISSLTFSSSFCWRDPFIPPKDALLAHLLPPPLPHYQLICEIQSAASRFFCTCLVLFKLLQCKLPSAPLPSLTFPLQVSQMNLKLEPEPGFYIPSALWPNVAQGSLFSLSFYI